MNKHFPLRLLLLMLPLFCLSCLSKKKHLEALNLQKNKSDATLQEAIDLRESKLSVANKNINELELQLAERKGENNILVSLRKELEAQISGLEGDIENMSSKSSSTQQNLSATVRQKDKEIAELKNLIQEVDAVLERHVSVLEQVANDLNFQVQYINQEKYELSTGQDQVNLHLQIDLIFKPKSVTKLQDTALPLFEKISSVLEKYPSMTVMVTGHTNNSPPRRKADVDNWNVSAQRAASVVRLLTEEFDLNPSQVVLAAKGEYAPIGSNATEAGKNKNARIELAISPRSEALVRAIRKVTNR